MGSHLFVGYLLLLVLFQKVLSQKYVVDKIVPTENGVMGKLTLVSRNSKFPEEISNLDFQFFYETSNRLRLKITDSTKERYEVPNVVISQTPPVAPKHMNYTVKIEKNPFSFSVVRKSDNFIIFDTVNSTFYYCNQFIELSTKIYEENPNFYGLGERKFEFKLNNEHTYVIWNHDQDGTKYDMNLYGTHPYYMQVLKNGKSHSVFFLNSNAMEFQISEKNSTLTWRSIGGIADIFFFVGDSPKEVTKQFLKVVGTPYLPPYWSLGNHQSRFGYLSINITKGVYEKFKEYQFPLDCMWNDLDFMDKSKMFTNNPVTFPYDEYYSFIKELNDNHQHYVQIFDPAIRNETGYKPFELGLEKDVFLRKNDGIILNNLLWFGYGVWLDWFNPKTNDWLSELMKEHLEKFPISGVWVDMNDPATFCDGECYGENPEGNKIMNNYVKFDPNNPPYLPYQIKNINKGTMRQDGITFLETIQFADVLQKLTKKRQFILSRSTYSGSQRFTQHWLGDCSSTYEDLRYSISTILSLSIMGLGMVGSDICGFNGFTTEELCTRWYQVGSFYGFMRNHNSIISIPQEPWTHGKILLESSKKYTLMRYELLPHLYTLHFLFFKNSEIYFRPLLFEFPDDPNVFPLDKQFLIGPSLLVSPVVDKGEITVKTYIPDSLWFDYSTGEELKCKKKEFCELDAPIDYLNVFIRGGFIISRKTPELTSYKTRLNPFKLLVALDENGNSEGYIYFDDGISLDTYKNQEYSSVNIIVSKKDNKEVLITKVEKSNFRSTNINLQEVIVYGVQTNVKTVLIQGKDYKDFEYNETNKKLLINDLSLSILDEIEISFF